MSSTAQQPPASTGSTKLDAVKQEVSAAAPPKLSGINLYSRFAFAGAVCCSLTHGGLTPVDVYATFLCPGNARHTDQGWCTA